MPLQQRLHQLSKSVFGPQGSGAPEEAVNHWMSQSRSMSQKYEKPLLTSENSSHRYFQKPCLRVSCCVSDASYQHGRLTGSQKQCNQTKLSRVSRTAEVVFRRRR